MSISTLSRRLLLSRLHPLPATFATASGGGAPRRRRTTPRTTVPSSAAMTNFSPAESAEPPEPPPPPPQENPFKKSNKKKKPRNLPSLEEILRHLREDGLDISAEELIEELLNGLSPPSPDHPLKKPNQNDKPGDPTNLQEVFRRMREDGFKVGAAEMMDGLAGEGLNEEAWDLWSEIREKERMPAVVLHTTVVAAYTAAGKWKEAQRAYMRMLVCGVKPNAYTFTVLIKGAVELGGGVEEGRKLVLEMLAAGLRPSAAAYTAVVERYVKEGRGEEAREMVKEMKEKGFVFREDAVEMVKEEVRERRAPAIFAVLDTIFGSGSDSPRIWFHD